MTRDTPLQPVLSIKELSVNFKTERGLLQALRRVSIDIPPQQIVGLVGESGCGKSTVINAILRLLSNNAEINNGSIDLQDENILKMTPTQLRSVRGKRISVIFQDPMTSLNPALSIGKQMTDIQYRDQIGKKEKRQRSINMLNRVGIPDAEKRLKSYPHQFSGGMRQRIAIAMALIMEPVLLIADEPTTALDATLQIQIIELLKVLQKEFRCSVLFVSHHLGLVADFCDQVVVMYAGEVVESGNVRDIFHRPAHPYTKGLLECDPARIKIKTRILPTIPGGIPDLVELNDTCIFNERCSIKQNGCPLTVAPLTEITSGHFVQCHLNQKGISK
jgi:oligopeptide/dipeptide ABC transporter ATP-binding protein